MTKMLTPEQIEIAKEVKFLQRQREVFDTRFDANETPYLERQYVQLRTKEFIVEFAPSIARTFADIASDIDPFTDVFSYYIEEEVGAAKIGSYAAKDVPRVDFGGKEVFGKVVPVVDSFGWNIGEMGQAVRLNRDISGKKMRTARNAMERGVDKLLAYGSIADETGALPALGLGGLVNSAAVAANGISALGFWVGGGVTPDVIMAQLSAMVATISNRTNGAYTPNTILLPQAQYNYIQQIPFSTLSGDSILTVFRKNNPGITMIAPWWRLSTAGVSGVPRALVYTRSPDVVELVLPLDFTVLPPEAQGFELVYNCHARCGGALFYRPFAAQYGDFATS